MPASLSALVLHVFNALVVCLKLLTVMSPFSTRLFWVSVARRGSGDEGDVVRAPSPLD